jgi:hypothetical protein
VVDSAIDASTVIASELNESALVARGSNLCVRGTTMVGTRGSDGFLMSPDGGPGGAALVLRGGTALVVGSDLEGGRGGSGNAIFASPGDGGDGGPAVRLVRARARRA